MNTAALKAFAPAVRRQLLEAVSRKLDYVLTAQTPDYLTTYASQVAALRKLAQEDRAGLIERVAYTWFNRLTALRYLDARGWHPFRCRVLMAATPDETQPEILKLMRTGALPSELAQHTNPVRLNDLLDGRIPSPDPQGEVYRHLVLAACHFYHALLPDVFERLDDETELLLPDDLLTEHSVAQPFRTEITDEDCAEVEIIGWLYQFYISERKDEVMARKSAVSKEDIPAVTQLFTPHWIVRYLVENSLGRLWLLNRPSSRLREKMPYYIEGEPETDFLRITRPEEIRILDPACGSGHMLTYAFDLLYAIYEEEGYPASDIPALILKHNLHGLDICPRAAQLADLALLFKAREKSRRFFQPEFLVRPNIMELREVCFVQNELRDYIHALDLGGLFNDSLLRLMYQFEEAKNFGSLIQPCLDEETIAFVRGAVESKDLGGQLFLHETHLKVLRVLDQAAALSTKYDFVVLNPPYMNRFNSVLKTFIERNFKDYSSDLFSVFVIRSKQLSRAGGLLGFMTPFVWMFISSYEKFRRDLLSQSTLTSLVQLEYSGFDGATVPICVFTLTNRFVTGRWGTFIRLTEFRGARNQGPKTLEAIQNPTCGWLYRSHSDDFKKIPGCPIAYWVTPGTFTMLEGAEKLGSIAEARMGLATGNNNKYVRLWHECDLRSIGFCIENRTIARNTGLKWFPYCKGGPYRKWYGNNEYVVDWQDDGRALQTTMHPSGHRIWAHNFNLECIFRDSITWSDITSGYLSVRFNSAGFLFDGSGTCAFFNSEREKLTALGLLNTTFAREFAKVLNPTLHFQTGDFRNMPYKGSLGSPRFIANVRSMVDIARLDWDNFETSWDFQDLPVLRACLTAVTLEASWQNWQTQCASAIRRMQELETENNRLFIEAYGLQDELSPEVPEEQITLARADARRDMAAFLSYAVGCMMGRYSLDQPGLILAEAGARVVDYLSKVGKTMDELTFQPDEDGIVPVLDGEWFEDDIVARTREFLRATFGDATLRDNIRFIEDSLGKDLRKYFLTDFYKDHLQTYKKRPIYWMVQSPRKSFSVLIYLHRYTRDTMNLVLNRYLREYEVKLRHRIEHLARVQADANTSTRDKTAARKESDKLMKALHDCEEWERQTVLPLAQARIELDLDDGVKTNYLKLGEAMAPIPGLAAAEE